MTSYSISQTPLSLCQHKMKTHLLLPPSSIVVPCVFSQNSLICSSNLKLSSPSLTKLSVKCSSSNRPPVGPGSGEADSKGVLDAFFLGKALAEAINERIESTVGEVLSVVGRLQAEQQKQVQEFQEDVLQRARKAKEKAAREALEAQSLALESAVKTTVTYASSPTDSLTAATSVTTNTTSDTASTAKDPFLGMLNDE